MITYSKMSMLLTSNRRPLGIQKGWSVKDFFYHGVFSAYAGFRNGFQRKR